MNAQRIRYLDDAKAVGILLVILGHCLWLHSVPGLSRLIYSFHIPFFFIISGFFVKPLSLSNGIAKYAKVYLKSYYISAVVALLFVLVISTMMAPRFDNLIKEWLVRTLYASGSSQGKYTSDIPYIGALWFLWALFWSCVLYGYFLYKGINDIIKSVIIVFCVALSVGSIDYVKLPLSIQAGCIALFYVWIGNLIKTYRIVDKVEVVLKNNKSFIFLVLLFWGASIALTNVDYGMCQIGFGPVNVFVSVLISIVLLIVIKHNELPAIVGKLIGSHTLSILCGHFTIHYIFYNFGWPARLLPFSPVFNLILEYSCELLGAFLLAGLYMSIGLQKK